MSDLITLTDETLASVLAGPKPVLLLFSNGEGVRGEFHSAFLKAAAENQNIVFAKLDPSCNPESAARFEVGSKPVLVAWAEGKEQARRHRPWGTDIAPTIDLLKAVSQPLTNTFVREEDIVNNPATVDQSPVNVTDETFEKEVIEYSKTTPVLVDFWAAWCGPCRAVAPILEKLAKEFSGQVRIAKVDVDANPGLSQHFQVMSIPNIMAIKNRTIVFNQPGALPEAAFRDLVRQLIALEVPTPEK